jgi:hypothetical protein
LALLQCTTFAAAQRVRWVLAGNRTDAGLGYVVQKTTDFNGDGVSDLLVSDRSSSRVGDPVSIVSGFDGTTLRVLHGQFPLQGFGSTIADIGDTNGDGTSDLAIGSDVMYRIELFSGLDGSRLRLITSANPGLGSTLARIGDFDQDGNADLVAKTSYDVSIYSGATGATLGTYVGPTLFTLPGARLISLPDLDGDRREEVLLLSTWEFRILHATPDLRSQVLQRPATSTVGFSFGSTCVADLDGDGELELLIDDDGISLGGQVGGIFVMSPQRNAQIDLIRAPRPGERLATSAMACVGDLDADGCDDVILMRWDIGQLALLSGRTRRIKDYWIPSSQFIPMTVMAEGATTLGDIDGDGFQELAIGNPSTADSRGQCLVISTRLLAASDPVAAGCGEGTSPPRIGVSRPILGDTARIEIRDAPLNAPGILVISAEPLRTTNLGAAGCDAVFDFAAWSTYASLSGSTNYNLTLPIPPLAQLAGFHLAVQCFFGPTNGPLGFDLSNGIWARVGYR